MLMWWLGQCGRGFGSGSSSACDENGRFPVVGNDICWDDDDDEDDAAADNAS